MTDNILSCTVIWQLLGLQAGRSLFAQTHLTMYEPCSEFSVIDDVQERAPVLLNMFYLKTFVAAVPQEPGLSYYVFHISFSSGGGWIR